MAQQVLLDTLVEGLEGLGEDVGNPVKNAFEDGESFLASGEDGELIVKVVFRAPVKMSQIRIKATGDEDVLPEHVKIWQGKADMAFTDIEDPCSHEGPLDADELRGKSGAVLALRLAKFQSVQTLQLFFSNEKGREKTKIDRIQLIGEPAQNMDMKEFKPVKG